MALVIAKKEGRPEAAFDLLIGKAWT